MTTLIPPLNGRYFPPENEDDPYGVKAAQIAEATQPAATPVDVDELRRRVHG